MAILITMTMNSKYNSGLLRRLTGLPAVAAVLVPVMTSCYTDFVPDIDVSPVLCVNSMITAGEPITVSVSRSRLYTDTFSDAGSKVDDAVVTIYANGSAVEASYLPAEGDRIRILVESRTYGTAVAEVTVPVCLPAEKLQWCAAPNSVWTQTLPGWEMVAQITFDVNAELTVADPAGTENFYKVDFYGTLDGEVVSGGGWFDQPEGPVYFYPGSLDCDYEPIFSEHIDLLESVSGTTAYGFSFFTDRTFQGGSYPLHLRFTDMTYNVSSMDYDESLLDCEIVIELSSISQSYYKWGLYDWQIDNGLLGDMSEIGFGDPLPGYSNVSTGAGIVAARSSRSYRISLRDFLREVVSGQDQ